MGFWGEINHKERQGRGDPPQCKLQSLKGGGNKRNRNLNDNEGQFLSCSEDEVWSTRDSSSSTGGKVSALPCSVEDVCRMQLALLDGT